MKNLRVTVNMSEAELVEIARHQLGLVPLDKLVDVSALQAVMRKRSEKVDAAIEAVLRATRKFDQDKFSIGEASAANALFGAGKRLREAVAEEKNARSMKGNFNV